MSDIPQLITVTLEYMTNLNMSAVSVMNNPHPAEMSDTPQHITVTETTVHF